MIHLLTIIGARPQIIKAAAFSRAVAAWNNTHSPEQQVVEAILHTGQHYDDNMSAVFFRELGIPEPDYNLHVGSGSHGVQTARMMEGIENVLVGAQGEGCPFDGVVLYGDTNSTLAGAVAASKLHVPVFHIEAGLRSFNMAMPEEINRIVCDQLASVLFAPTGTAVANLHREGFVLKDEKAPEALKQRRFRNGKGQYALNSGDVMYDNAVFFAPMAEQRSDILQRLQLADKQFVMATVHRPANTDDAANLTNIMTALADIADSGIDVVLPLHPRTRKLLPGKLPDSLLQRIENSQHLKLTDPVSFFEIICLERHARIVMTDSGGVQKESFFYGTPCVILRPETEWVEIVEAGAGIIADADYQRIMQAYNDLSGRQVHFPPLFGDGHAADCILDAVVKYLSSTTVQPA